jgi:hypothetical protein
MPSLLGRASAEISPSAGNARIEMNFPETIRPRTNRPLTAKG